MSVFTTTDLCEGAGVKPTRQRWPVCLATVLAALARLAGAAQDTNPPTAAQAPAPVTARADSTPAAPTRASPAAAFTNSQSPDASPSRLDESAFRIVTERNIFNANRSGGQVRLSSRRPSRVESFTLVGTIAYEKGAFAFFQGSSSELTRVLKAEGTIAGHKLVDILADSVKLEADGKVLELVVGSAMRREDEGTWKPGEAVASSTGGSSRQDDSNSSRSRGGDDRRPSASSPGFSTAQAENYRQDKQDRKEDKKEVKLDAKAEADILKRLMERRERESE